MYQCKCGKEFEKQSSLNSHARFCNKYEKIKKKTNYLINNKYVCECGKEFEKAQSLNAHFSRCVQHRKGIPPKNNRGGGGWSKGMTKETNEGVAKMAKSVSISNKNRIVSDKTKELLSKKRINYLEKNPNVKWYISNNGHYDIKVQGLWEKNVAEWLNINNIKWDRHQIKYDTYRTYTPDFWLPEFNMYIEVKGWMRDSDILKMKKVINEHNIKLMILDKTLYKILDKITINDLIEFKNWLVRSMDRIQNQGC